VFEDVRLPPSPKITGAKITVWPDDGPAETEIEAEFVPRLRFLAQSTWGPTTRPDPDLAVFTRRANTVGRARA
jgi:hexosaminidase